MICTHCGHLCAKCGEDLNVLTDDAVWTCPADCDPSWPGWEQTPEYTANMTEEQREAAGVFSNCPEDYGVPCPYEHVPMHGRCYNDEFERNQHG